MISQVCWAPPTTVILCLQGKEGKGLTICSTGHIIETVQVEIAMLTVETKKMDPVSERIKHSRCFISEQKSRAS